MDENIRKLIFKIFPFLFWLKDYRKENLIKDFLAGLTISVVLIPQSMSYAMIAGLPPIYGLYAASIPPVVAALWGRASLLATGPVAMVSLLTFSSIIPFAKPGTPEYINMAINLALLVGLIQFLMGAFRLGFIMRFVSHPVIVGFTNAAAIIIASTQIQHLLGISVKGSEFILPMFLEIGKNISNTNTYTLAVGLFAFTIIIAGKKIHDSFPGAMVASVITTLLVYALNLNEAGVKTIGDLPKGLPSPSFTFVDFEHTARLIGPALVIAIVGFMEAMAITKAISSRTREPVDINQELIGQGAANIIGSLFKSYPVSGSFSRSAVNLQAGGKTGLSNIFSGLIVIAVLLFFTSTFYYLPKATLAAIVMHAATGLIKHSQFIKLYRTSKHDGIIALITFSFCFITKPDYAIFIGIAVSLLFFLWESMTPRIAILTRNPKTEIFEDYETNRLPFCPQILYLRPEFSIYFANAEFIREYILKKVEESKNGLKFVLIDMEAVNRIDATGIDEMKELIGELRKMDIELYIANVHKPVREVLHNSSIMTMLKQDKCLKSKAESITLLFNKLDHKYCKEKCPFTVFWECETVK
ncbi:MAG: sulfate permease [Thermodesulfovibrionales bacterium]|nr:sulfate permease [Thermodesulfovibrionales bacterium]